MVNIIIFGIRLSDGDDGMVGCMPSLGPKQDDSIKTTPAGDKKIFYMVTVCDVCGY